MPDIKSRDVVSGTIKAVDRSALAGQRMKDAYVQAKDRAEHSVYSSESSEEYASNRMEESAETIARESVHQIDVLGHKVLRHKKQPWQSVAESPAESPQASADNGNPTNAQQPHRVTPDGAVPSKQEAIRNQQITSAKTDLKAKRTSKRIVTSSPQMPQTICAILLTCAS